MPPKKLKVVTGGEFVGLVSDRLDDVTEAEVRRILNAMTEEVADCIVNGYQVNVGTIVKVFPRYKPMTPKGKRPNPFKPEEPPKMRPAIPESVAVKAQALAGSKRDLPKNMNTQAGQALIAKLPRPKKTKKKS